MPKIWGKPAPNATFLPQLRVRLAPGPRAHQQHEAAPAGAQPAAAPEGEGARVPRARQVQDGGGKRACSAPGGASSPSPPPPTPQIPRDWLHGPSAAGGTRTWPSPAAEGDPATRSPARSRTRPRPRRPRPRRSWSRVSSGAASKDSLCPPPCVAVPSFSHCAALPLPGEGEGTWLGGRKGRPAASRACLGAAFPFSPPKFCCKQSHLSSPSPRVHPDQRQAAHVGQEAGKSGRVPRGRIESDLIEPPRPHRAPLCPPVQPLVF